MQIYIPLKKILNSVRFFTFMVFLIVMPLESNAVSTPIKTPSDINQIASQLRTIQNPTAELAAVITNLQALDASSAANSLEEMSGQQYALSFVIGESSARQFLRRLYDPLRPIVTKVPCNNSHQYCVDSSLDTCWLESDLCQYSLYLAPWLEAGAGGTNANNRGCHFKGLKHHQWDIAGGVQASTDSLTLGIAGSYQKDTVNYNLNGSGRGKSGYGALYGLYRPFGWYVLGDLGYGLTKNRLKRHVEVGAADYQVNGKYGIDQFLSYIEAGFDVCCKGSLFQPFLGFECNQYFRNRINEKGQSPLNLSIGSKSLCATYSRLGFHLTTEIDWFSECPMDHNSSLSFDFAWTYRLTGNPKYSLKESFQSFGDTFTTKGVSNNRNGIDGALTFTTHLFDRFQFYAEALGFYWGKNLSYSFLGGVNYTW